MKQTALYKISGMNRDIADSAMSKQHAFSIHNMRLSHDEKNVFTALVNEPGTLKARDASGKIVDIVGTVIGFNTLNDTGILFTHIEDGVNYRNHEFIPDEKDTNKDEIYANPETAPQVVPTRTATRDGVVTQQPDRIYLVNVAKRDNIIGAGDDTAVTVFEYFCGDLGFSVEHPIESTVYFENDEVQKVYWVDGINVMRYANIVDRNGSSPWTNNLMFDSVPKLSLNETMTVVRNSEGGVFPSGTVQFAFTYLNRYGAESNIVWMSPIYYSSPDDRGGAPDEICANSFTISISGYETDDRFDYVRLYHLLRTTLDGEVSARRIADVAIPDDGSDIIYTDTNTTGETVDPNEVLYLGGVSVVPETIEQKSNTLFLGNLHNNYSYLCDVDGLADIVPQGSTEFSETNSDGFFQEESSVPADTFSGYYSHVNQLLYNSYQITSFRRGEEYRLGFQAQDGTGRWSDVWWLGDYTNDSAYPKYDNGVLKVAHARFLLSSAAVNLLIGAGYKKVRPVVVYPQPWERNIYTEGLLNPTVYNVRDRASNAPFAQSSWFLRPFPPVDLGSFDVRTDNPLFPGLDKFGNISGNDNVGNSETRGYCIPFPESYSFSGALTGWGSTWAQGLGGLTLESLTGYDYSMFGAWAEFRHNHQLGDSQQRNGEIQSMYSPREASDVKYDSDHPSILNPVKYTLKFPYLSVTGFKTNKTDFITSFPDFYYVDQSILTMNSADIEFDTSLQVAKFNDSKLRIVGLIPMSSFISSYEIRTNTPPNKFYDEYNDSMLIPQGFYGSEIVGATMEKDSGHGWKSFISAPIWHDDLAFNTVASNANPKYENALHNPLGFAVYPWHASGSLNNDSVGSRRVYPTLNDDGDETDQSKESRSNTGDNYISAELKMKTLANMHYSYNTHRLVNLSKAIDLTAQVATFLDTQSVSLTKIDEPVNSNLGTLHYFGNVDKLITPAISSSSESDAAKSTKDYPLTRIGGYPKMVSFMTYVGGNFSNQGHTAFEFPYTPLGLLNLLNYSEYGTPWRRFSWLKEGSDRTAQPITIRYNSCNHLVLALDYFKDGEGTYQQYLGFGGTATGTLAKASFGGESISNQPFWGTDETGKTLAGIMSAHLFDLGDISVSDYYDFYGTEYSSLFDDANIFVESSSFVRTSFNSRPTGYLYMGQLYRATAVENKFGGTSNEALEQNRWLPAGEAVKLVADNAAQLVWRAGDTYYQRYDALRTYPQTEEDMNKVIDIVSFMTETHTNIDGRYDKNRGLQNNNHVRPKNFNKLNYVYSQKDNFFSYSTINPDKVHLDTFKYSFTWTLSKVAGALRDEWTRITLANTYDCDGNKGELTRIARLDNLLVAFQSGGISQIMFNENVQLQGSEGTPIELANSGKMTGLRYYTTEVGCQNKWSIAVAPNGIYFIDGRSKDLYALGADGVKNISLTQGMSSWFKSRNDLMTRWCPSPKPYKWEGFFSHWDMTTGELFLTTQDTCLCFDTSLGVFSSFYDYNRMDAMFALSGTVLTVHRDDDATQLHPGFEYDQIWLHRKNRKQYCYMFNQQRQSSVEIVCNGNNEGSDYGTSKIFDNMTWRADAWEWALDNNAETWTYKPFVTFSRIDGFDDYQKFGRWFNMTTGNTQTSNPHRPINLRKKFKQWHTTIPRAIDENDNEGRDRIRDTWCHITLTLGKTYSQYRHVLHDLAISYFIP